MLPARRLGPLIHVLLHLRASLLPKSRVEEAVFGVSPRRPPFGGFPWQRSSNPRVGVVGTWGSGSGSSRDGRREPVSSSPAGLCLALPSRTLAPQGLSRGTVGVEGAGSRLYEGGCVWEGGPVRQKARKEQETWSGGRSSGLSFHLINLLLLAADGPPDHDHHHHHGLLPGGGER